MFGEIFDKDSGMASKLKSLNWNLIFIVFLLNLVGFVMLFSAGGGNIYPWMVKQVVYFIVFFPMVLMIAMLDMKVIAKNAYLFYIMVVIMLIVLDFHGKDVMGARRWLDFGIINIQPSELMKIGISLVLAKYYSELSMENVRSNKYLLFPLLLLIIPALLIIEQPDLGTALVILGIAAIMLFAVGIQIWKFAAVLIVIICSIPFIWNFVLHDYQKQRIVNFINPEQDILGSGYNIMQSKIAIGSGGFLGKGYIDGSQSQLDFLPEKQTDFIFTTIGEEFGFIGSVFVIVTYMSFIISIIFIATNTRDNFGKLVAIGIGAQFFIHMFVNIAMTMGLVPVVGVPLPFISYGGTIMVVSLVAVGIVLNIDRTSRQDKLLN